MTEEVKRCPVCGYGLEEVFSKGEGPADRYRCDKHSDILEVKLLVPKKIIDFLEVCGEDPQEFLEHAILKGVEGDLHSDVFRESLFRHALEKVDLTSILKVPLC